MKVNDPNLSSLTSAEAAKSSQAAKAARASETQGANQSGQTGATGSGDDVHLSELVRSLRTLAADSPERQAFVDQIAKTYASGNYQVDANATAGKIIDDAASYK